MAEEVDDFYAGLGGIESRKYVILKVKDIHTLAGFINNTVVSMPSYQKAKLSKIYNSCKEVMILFIAKTGDSSVDSTSYW